MNTQDIPINFGKGLSTKQDPRQIPPQNFLSLENMIFQEGGALTKRNGYAQDPTEVINPVSVNLSVVPSTIGSGRLVTAFNNEKILCRRVESLQPIGFRFRMDLQRKGYACFSGSNKY
jgi:hypothetical protein